MGDVVVLGRRGFGETTRRDAWWVQPLLVFLALSAFIVYATWAAFQDAHYRSGSYLSPFYSPEIFGDAEHSWFGGRPDWWPGWFPWSAAFFILWAPGGFRRVPLERCLPSVEGSPRKLTLGLALTCFAGFSACVSR